MIQTADVVVVGGGVNGASITYALAARGVKVVLVEKGALASGASGRSSALVRMHYTNEWDSRLAWASFPVFKHWTELMGGPAVFTHTGFVNVVAPQYADNLRRNVEMLKGLGVNTSAITAAELKELQPFANVDDIGAAAYEPDSGYANPAETVEGFRRRADGAGRAGTPVDGGDARDPSGEPGDRRRDLGRAHRRGQRHRGRRRVVASTLHGVRPRPAGAAQGHRHGGGDASARRCARDIWSSSTMSRATTSGPKAAGSRSSGCRARSGTSIPTRSAPGLSPQAADMGAQLLMHRIPAMERATLARGYRAFDGYSADRHAILGRVDGIDGLYLATAFSGSGFKISPAVGLCMAELVLDGRAKTVDIEPFSLRRFAEGRTVEGPYPYAVRADYIDPKAARVA